LWIDGSSTDTEGSDLDSSFFRLFLFRLFLRFLFFPLFSCCIVPADILSMVADQKAGNYRNDSKTKHVKQTKQRKKNTKAVSQISSF